jgi:hypothetical protein
MVVCSWACSYSHRKCLLLPSCPSACISAVPAGQISVKFDIGDCYENLSR